jgi:dihydrofolate synthase/folylpolyglutamate synthase
VRYVDAIGTLFALQSRGIRLGVSRMQEALAYRGHPDRGLRFVHVTGTNGKGSTASMIAACTRAAGHRTGLFTSPHVHRWVERIRIDGRPIGEREAARRLSDLLTTFAQPDAPETTFFELTTLCAIEAFRDRGCEVCVMEIGLGGRLDATNATDSQVSVVTSIALDHVNILGGSIATIAGEKAGIFRRGVPVVLGTRDPIARRTLNRRARALQAPVQRIDRDFAVEPTANDRFAVRVGNDRIDELSLAVPGTHQRDNAACAVAALKQLERAGIDVPPDAIRRGLRRTRWPGRLEWVKGAPPVLLDAAHNVAGSEALARYLKDTPCEGPTVLVFGSMADKNCRGMLRALKPVTDHVIYAPIGMPRAASTAALARLRRGERATSLRAAIARAKRIATRRGRVVIAGSIFLVAEARAQLLKLRTDPLIRM